MRLNRIIIVSFNIYKKLYNILKEIQFHLIIGDERSFHTDSALWESKSFNKITKKKIRKQNMFSSEVVPHQ
ncbi:hypothetical protein PFDG_05181 [Plasmodium falciparum Dd2]|uniref:Uncharacterized protein n=1 Tax=Plasmodium falciparum (isolate Dd2) TaxID=57267 RepID=A0A0L7M9Y0_PLAF4|nr:hypothetical protein PFDG_05181 [Plasmodium falciparum Dd2]